MASAVSGEALDFGLRSLAASLGKCAAVKRYYEAVARENEGDCKLAITLYSSAYRLWPALDSVLEGGIPSGVRAEAEAAGLRCTLAAVDVSLARATSVARAARLLNDADIAAIEGVRTAILATMTPHANNAQNATHKSKQCLFLNNAPLRLFSEQAPCVLAKILSFASRAWAEQGWSATDASGHRGPLHAVEGGAASLSIRVIEYWQYAPGGGLCDLMHNDTDSVITLVAQLSRAEEEYEGGMFRTNELGGFQQEHPMALGDVVCFVSHKYHNVTPVTAGQRRVMVMELWQGGSEHTGR